ncbi:MAG: hypothetical protein RMX65_034175 [Nostoc sp. DedQUE01]|nr:hypothetical protein [Nostoc sp. DedQUE11]MDZ8071316.1 hypothetical protein [Nostoc sp. DedQUE01]MDZ8083569.1 hypothetical protein [Nostoc sp. DcaGUA01]
MAFEELVMPSIEAVDLICLLISRFYANYYIQQIAVEILSDR